MNKRRCNLIIDSCCDLPLSIVERMDVELLEFPFIMSDGEHLDDLGETMPPKAFYDLMRGGETPSTTQIPIPSYFDAFDRSLASGLPTVFLCFTSGLSGTYETALRLAAQFREEHPDFELYVVDTLLPSVAEGLLVHEAVRQRDRGLSAKELVSWVEEARYYVHGYFTIDGLEDLRRGGRIPDMAAYAGAKLDIKPTLSIGLDGELAFNSMCRGRKKSLKALLGIFDERAIDAERSLVIVASADADKDADFIDTHIRKRSDLCRVLRCDIGPVIGSHVGPGMVAVVFWGADRRADMSIADRIASAVSNSAAAAKGTETPLQVSGRAALRVLLGGSEENIEGADCASGK